MISNEGFASLSIISIQPRIAAPWLSFSQTPPFPLGVGESRVVEAIVDFDTALPGISGVYIDIESSDPDESPWPGGVALTVVNAGDNVKPEADAQTLETIQDTALLITLTGSDFEGLPLTFGLDDKPAHGQVELSPGDSGDGSSIIYTPDPGFSGVDSFTFVSNDWGQDSDPVLILINVFDKNDPPTFSLGTNPAWPPRESGAKIHPGWITNLSLGPPNESGQSLVNYIVSVTHDPDGVVSSLSVLNDGTLEYTLTGASGEEVNRTCNVEHKTTFRIDQIAGDCDYVIIGDPYFTPNPPWEN